VIRIDADYLRRTAASPAVRAVKQRAYELLRLQEGASVVDVGCGPGIDTVPLARIVGPAGYVFGIDADPAMVAEANRASSDSGTGAFTQHIVGQATALPLDTASADGCYSERLLQHLTWPTARRAVAEFVRVVRPGGAVVVVDTDWATLSIAAPDPLLERRVAWQHAAAFPNPFSGRYLPALLLRAGLVELTTETHALPLTYEAMEFLLYPTLRAGVASGGIRPFEAAQWWYAVRDLRNHGQFFAQVCLVLAAGRVPKDAVRPPPRPVPDQERADREEADHA
jgi:ubiquinone/menaquinone biosynthesis C-methylase UbiE